MFNNPFYVLRWNAEDNCTFLKHYHKIFEENSRLCCLEEAVFDPIFYHRIPKKLLLDQMYFEGKFVYQALTCSYSEFCGYMEGGLPRKCFRYFKPRWFSSRYLWYYYRYRERMSYRRLLHHDKKELSQEEQNRRAWREEKQFERDKAKRIWRRSCGKYNKKRAHEKHRAWQRNYIETEKYEELLDTSKLKGYQDSWWWD